MVKQPARQTDRQMAFCLLSYLDTFRDNCGVAFGSGLVVSQSSDISLVVTGRSLTLEASGVWLSLFKNGFVLVWLITGKVPGLSPEFLQRYLWGVSWPSE